jgi:hypothetical protein
VKPVKTCNNLSVVKCCKILPNLQLNRHFDWSYGKLENGWNYLPKPAKELLDPFCSAHVEKPGTTTKSP